MQSNATLPGMDQFCSQALDALTDVAKNGLTEESFSDSISETFTTVLTDGEEVQLVENGRDIRVTFANRFEFIRLVERVRLHESENQIRALQSGLASVVPLSVLSYLWTWQDLELAICGRPDFKVADLKRVTEFSADWKESDSAIQYLWDILENDFSAQYVSHTLHHPRLTHSIQY